MEVRNKNFAAYIDVFTPNTYIMVIQSDVSIRKCFCVRNLPSYLCHAASAATLVNVANARDHFERLEGAKLSSGE